MARSILLLIERKDEGKGPVIPLRNRVTTVSAVGVAEGDGVVIHVRSPHYENRFDAPLRTIVVTNGTAVIEPIEAGHHLRAHLSGNNSVATVWVE